MFNFGIGPIGAPNGLGCNGFANMVITSEINANNVIRSFERYLSAGFGAEAALTQAYIVNNVSENNLTDFDKERIKRKVEDVTNFGWDWR